MIQPPSVYRYSLGSFVLLGHSGLLDCSLAGWHIDHVLDRCFESGIGAWFGGDIGRYESKRLGCVGIQALGCLRRPSCQSASACQMSTDSMPNFTLPSVGNDPT
jgi:hypothetical protein